MKWFDNARGYGFISPDDGGTDLFVHHTALSGEGLNSLAKGETVEYVSAEGAKGSEAKNVVALASSVAGRALQAARPASHRRGSAMRGQMLWFNERKNHGFIMTDEGERLGVAGGSFAAGQKPQGRCARKVVTFEIDATDGTRRAENVVFEPEVSARRARMRRRGIR